MNKLNAFLEAIVDGLALAAILIVLIIIRYHTYL